MNSPLTNPSEIAREALRRLASRRMLPTPDNYRVLYHEIAGAPPREPFPEQSVKALLAALPKATTEQLRLSRQIEQGMGAGDWESCKQAIAQFVHENSSDARPAWGNLIAELVRQWDARQAGITQARKRDALERVLSVSDPETLYARLQGLMRNWAQAPGGEGVEVDSDTSTEPRNGNEAPPSHPAEDDSPLLGELRELFAFTLDSAIAPQLAETPNLSSEALSLAGDLRNAQSLRDLKQLLARIKNFAFRLELLSSDQAEIQGGLRHLLQLLIENISELIIDDRWLHGQVAIIREIVGQPLNLRTIDDAERRIKEVIYKQSQLKFSLREAQEALKKMLAGFVDHLADFAESTSDYHDKIEVCAQKIASAQDIGQLSAVVEEVMRETRVIQVNAQRSRDELRATRRQVEETEGRVRQLQQELDQVSVQVRHDQLTGALNRKGMEEALDKEISRCARHRTPLCVAMLDIDNFKKLNDAHGHQAGDAALVHLTQVIRTTMRPQDTVARFGGEEFLILLPDTAVSDAGTALTRLQRELTKRYFLHDNQKLLITFSAGVTEYQVGETRDTAISRADGAMYEAKQAGKNRVVLA